MGPLCNREAIIFLPYGFFYLLLSFFPRLISAVGDWMSTIFPHMVWPQCEFRMQVWNVLHAARWKCGTQKIAICAPSDKFVGLYLRNVRHISTIRQKKLLDSDISSTCPYNMVNFGPLAAEIVSFVWGTPANFNGFRNLAALLHGIRAVGASQTAALNHLYSPGRPSRWALAIHWKPPRILRRSSGNPCVGGSQI